MKTLTHTYDQVVRYVVSVPGICVVRIFVDYATAWAYTQQVLADTGHVACVENLYG